MKPCPPIWPQALLLGATLAFVLIFPERYFIALLHRYPTSDLTASLARSLIVALWEEVPKWALLRSLLPQKSARPLVGLAVGLGFASTENLWYIVQYGLDSIYSRLLSGSLIHLCLGILVAVKIPQKTALISALLWHSTYNMTLELEWGLWAAALLTTLLFYTAWQTYSRSSNF